MTSLSLFEDFGLNAEDLDEGRGEKLSDFA